VILPYSGGTGIPPLQGLPTFGDLLLSSAPKGSVAGSAGSLLDMNDRNNRWRTSEAPGDPFFSHPWSDILVPSVHGTAMVGGGL
jgi:hypothetical protein